MSAAHVVDVPWSLSPSEAGLTAVYDGPERRLLVLAHCNWRDSPWPTRQVEIEFRDVAPDAYACWPLEHISAQRIEDSFERDLSRLPIEPRGEESLDSGVYERLLVKGATRLQEVLLLGDESLVWVVAGSWEWRER